MRINKNIILTGMTIIHASSAPQRLRNPESLLQLKTKELLSASERKSCVMSSCDDGYTCEVNMANFDGNKVVRVGESSTVKGMYCRTSVGEFTEQSCFCYGNFCAYTDGFASQRKADHYCIGRIAAKSPQYEKEAYRAVCGDMGICQLGEKKYDELSCESVCKLSETTELCNEKVLIISEVNHRTIISHQNEIDCNSPLLRADYDHPFLRPFGLVGFMPEKRINSPQDSMKIFNKIFFGAQKWSSSSSSQVVMPKEIAAVMGEDYSAWGGPNALFKDEKKQAKQTCHLHCKKLTDNVRSLCMNERCVIETDNPSVFQSTGHSCTANTCLPNYSESCIDFCKKTDINAVDCMSEALDDNDKRCGVRDPYTKRVSYSKINARCSPHDCYNSPFVANERNWEGNLVGVVMTGVAAPDAGPDAYIENLDFSYGTTFKKTSYYELSQSQRQNVQAIWKRLIDGNRQAAVANAISYPSFLSSDFYQQAINELLNMCADEQKQFAFTVRIAEAFGDYFKEHLKEFMGVLTFDSETIPRDHFYRHILPITCRMRHEFEPNVMENKIKIKGLKVPQSHLWRRTVKMTPLSHPDCKSRGAIRLTQFQKTRTLQASAWEGKSYTPMTMIYQNDRGVSADTFEVSEHVGLYGRAVSCDYAGLSTMALQYFPESRVREYEQLTIVVPDAVMECTGMTLDLDTMAHVTLETYASLTGFKQNYWQEIIAIATVQNAFLNEGFLTINPSQTSKTFVAQFHFKMQRMYSVFATNEDATERQVVEMAGYKLGVEGSASLGFAAMHEKYTRYLIRRAVIMQRDPERRERGGYLHNFSPNGFLEASRANLPFVSSTSGEPIQCNYDDLRARIAAASAGMPQVVADLYELSEYFESADAQSIYNGLVDAYGNPIDVPLQQVRPEEQLQPGAPDGAAYPDGTEEQQPVFDPVAFVQDTVYAFVNGADVDLDILQDDKYIDLAIQQYSQVLTMGAELLEDRRGVIHSQLRICREMKSFQSRQSQNSQYISGYLNSLMKEGFYAEDFCSSSDRIVAICVSDGTEMETELEDVSLENLMRASTYLSQDIQLDESQLSSFLGKARDLVCNGRTGTVVMMPLKGAYNTDDASSERRCYDDVKVMMDNYFLPAFSGFRYGLSSDVHFKLPCQGNDCPLGQAYNTKVVLSLDVVYERVLRAMRVVKGTATPAMKPLLMARSAALCRAIGRYRAYEDLLWKNSKTKKRSSTNRSEIRESPNSSQLDVCWLSKLVHFIPEALNSFRKIEWNSMMTEEIDEEDNYKKKMWSTYGEVVDTPEFQNWAAGHYSRYLPMDNGRDSNNFLARVFHESFCVEVMWGVARTAQGFAILASSKQLRWQAWLKDTDVELNWNEQVRVEKEGEFSMKTSEKNFYSLAAGSDYTDDRGNMLNVAVNAGFEAGSLLDNLNVYQNFEKADARITSSATEHHEQSTQDLTSDSYNIVYDDIVSYASKSFHSPEAVDYVLSDAANREMSWKAQQITGAIWRSSIRDRSGSSWGTFNAALNLAKSHAAEASANAQLSSLIRACSDTGRNTVTRLENGKVIEFRGDNMIVRDDATGGQTAFSQGEIISLLGEEVLLRAQTQSGPNYATYVPCDAAQRFDAITGLGEAVNSLVVALTQVLATHGDLNMILNDGIQELGSILIQGNGQPIPFPQANGAVPEMYVADTTMDDLASILGGEGSQYSFVEANQYVGGQLANSARTNQPGQGGVTQAVAGASLSQTGRQAYQAGSTAV